MNFTKHTIALIFTFIVAHAAQAQIDYSESIDGDLGGPSAPTDLGVAGLGLNTVSGTLLNSVSFDPDAFSFTIEAGQQLDTLSFSSMEGSNHFFAFNDGPLDQSSAGGNLIATLISSTDVGTNILDGSLNSFGGSGLSGGPLGPGTYHVWFQETNGSDNDYTIAFTTSIPEPASASVILLFGMSSLFVRRKRTSVA